MKKLMYLFVSLALAACDGSSSVDEPQKTEQSDEQRRIELAKLTDDIYYVVGSQAQVGVVQDDGTAKCGMYLFVSENLQDTVSVYNLTKEGLPDKLFDGIFEFPAEIMVGNICGFTFFPEEYRYSYPVKINSHRPMTNIEELNSVVVCNAMIGVSDIYPNKFVIVKSLSKIE